MLKKVQFSLLVVFAVLAGNASSKDFSEGLEQKNLDLYKSIAGDLRCPTCTGLSILQSDAEFSNQMKEAVRDQVLSGKSKKEIMEFFTERYGLWILREPPSEGFHVLAWVIPSLLLIAGPLLIWFFVWRKKVNVKTYGVRSTEAILRELEDELGKLREKELA